MRRFLDVAPATRSGPAEGCLGALTVACVTEHFAEGADPPLHAVPSTGEHGSAARLLRELLERRPADLAAAEQGDALPVPRTVLRGGHFPYVASVAELRRAGLRGEAERLLRATAARDARLDRRPVRLEDAEAFVADLGRFARPGDAEQVFRGLRLMERARSFPDGRVPGTLGRRGVPARDAALPESAAGLLELASAVPAESRALILVAGARAEPEGLRPTAPLHLAACRAKSRR